MSEAPDWSGALHYVQSFTMKWRSETVKLGMGLKAQEVLCMKSPIKNYLNSKNVLLF